jgi:hypothetical protein
MSEYRSTQQTIPTPKGEFEFTFPISNKGTLLTNCIKFCFECQRFRLNKEMQIIPCAHCGGYKCTTFHGGQASNDGICTEDSKVYCVDCHSFGYYKHTKIIVNGKTYCKECDMFLE